MTLLLSPSIASGNYQTVQHCFFTVGTEIFHGHFWLRTRSGWTLRCQPFRRFSQVISVHVRPYYVGYIRQQRYVVSDPPCTQMSVLDLLEVGLYFGKDLEFESCIVSYRIVSYRIVL